MKECTLISVEGGRLMHYCKVLMKNFCLHSSVLQFINDMNQMWIDFKYIKFLCNKLS